MCASEFVRTEILPVSAVPGPTRESYGLTSASGTSPLLLDFGQELYGEFLVQVGATIGPLPVRLRVTLGESVAEALTGVFDDWTRPVAAGQPLRFGPTGFRFACLELVDTDREAEVVCPRAESIVRRVERRATFRSGDGRLDAVWEVGARTIELCLQDHVWDGVKRGRSVWAGDLYPAAAVVATLFGEHPVVLASLDHLRDQVFDGETVHGWMNGIPAYTLWWVLTQRDWFRAHGNRGYLEEQRAFLLALLPALSAGVGPDGRECLEDGWRFLDWASENDPDAVQAGYQGLFKLGLAAAAELCRELGEQAAATGYRDAAGRLVGWEPPARSKQAWALMSLAGLVAPDRAREVLASAPGEGLTPFLGFVVLEALSALGAVDAGLELVRRYWGGMIDLGATTFWEDFDLSWAPGATGIDRPVPDGGKGIHEWFRRCSAFGLAQSLCHGWSAGPTAWLSREVGGQPGCSRESRS